MPREAYLAAARALTLDDLVAASGRVDPTFWIRDGGGFWQVVGPDDEAVLTVDGQIDWDLLSDRTRRAVVELTRSLTT